MLGYTCGWKHFASRETGSRLRCPVFSLPRTAASLTDRGTRLCSAASATGSAEQRGPLGKGGFGCCPLPVQTFLLRYLLEGKQVAPTGKYLTFREMPWGELYIKPYTGRVLTRAAFTFGMKLAAFEAAAEKLGGKKLPHGDAGYEFSFIGGYTMQLLVWAGDDEFPPNAQVLYSDNFSQGFAPEDRVVAGDILITHIKSAM